MQLKILFLVFEKIHVHAMKIRSMLPKPNQLLLNNNPIFTLKIRSRSRLKIPGRLKRRIRYVHLKKRQRRVKVLH